MPRRTTVSSQPVHDVRSHVDKIRSRRRAFASLVAAVTLVDCTSHLRGATQTWTWAGTSNSSWNNAANWTPNSTFPSNGNGGFSDFTVIIPSVTTQPTLNVTATIDDLTLNTGATLSILGSDNFTLNGSAITDNGAIILNSNNSSSSDLTFTTATLSGTGTITLNSGTTGAVIAGTLTQASPHTINGLGEITAALTNNGTVDANVSGQALTLLTSAMANNALMEATGGGNLNISGIDITQGGAGQITASGTSSLVNLVSGATITGGTLNTASGGVIQATSSSTDTIVGVTNDGTFNIVGASNLNVTGNLADNGTITVNSNNSSSSAMTFSSGTLSGTGTITLNSGGSGAVIAGTLIQSSAHTINGYGEITAALTSNGTVNANVSGQVITLLTNNMSNSNLMEATGGGVLNVDAIAVTNTGGQFSASGASSAVNLIGGATITGGTLNTSTGGIFQATSSSTDTIANVTNNGTFNIVGASNLDVTGNLVDNGVITVNSNNSSNSAMTFSGGTLSGTGTVTLNETSSQAVLAGTLSQSSGHTINGYGEITAALTNNGLVNASVTSQTLFVSGVTVINTATMEATSGTLVFNSGVAVTNTGGTIAAAGANVVLNNASITGGTLKSTSPNVFLVQGATFNTLTIAANTAVDVQGGSGLTLAGSTLTNNGNIAVNYNDSSSSTLQVNSVDLLTGSGSVTLDAPTNQAVIATGTGDTLTQDVNHTINGFGEITASFINNGTVDANSTGNSLTLLTNNMTNNKLMEATAGAGLVIDGITLTNTTGQITASGAGSVVSLIGGATISGGTLNTSTGGIFQATSGSTDTIASVTNNGTFNIVGASNLSVTGNLVDNGLITVNSNDSSSSNLNFTGGTLSGTGTITLNAGSTQATLSGTLTQSSGHTINGYGEITAALTNNGTVNANTVISSTPQTIFVSSTAITNTSTMDATTGLLTFNNGVAVNNTGGIIAAVGNTVTFNNASITGGTLKSTSPNVFLVQGATFNTLTIAANTAVDVQGGSGLTLAGSTLTNNGNIAVNYNDSSSSTLQVNSVDLLTGSGSVTLDAPTNQAVIATGTGDTLTQDVNHTINGFGEITASFINNGTVDANSTGNSLTLLTNNMTNNKLMEATAGAGLVIDGITLTNTTGQITASGAGSVVSLIGGATISGGTLNTSTGGIFQATSGSTDTIASVTNNGTFNIVGASNLSVTGNLVDNGLITVNSNDSSSSNLNFTGGTLSGTGTITLNAGSTQATLSGTLTQSSGHTINGLGEITAALTNNGTVNANVSGQTLFLLTGPMTNNSIMEATGGAGLNISGITVTQVSPGQIAASGGTVNLTGAATITGGTLNGGTINSTSGTNTIGGLTNNATLNVVGASNLNISSAIVNNGVLVADSNSSSSSTITASGVVTGTGAIVINSGGTFAFTQNVGGSTQASLSIANGGRLDLDNNHMFINYGAGPDPIASIVAWIISGYNGGNWAGNGIFSTAAQTASGSYGIGYADSADPGNPAGLATHQIEIKYTLLGDANLDGKVNGTDFNILATNFNTGGDSWDQGDFTYDHKVNGSDFNVLAANFNQAATQATDESGGQSSAVAGDLSAVDAFAAANGLVSAVPEPCSGMLAGVFIMGALARRRRSATH